MAIYKNEPCFIYYFWQLQDHSLLVEALSRSIGSIDIFIPNGRCKDLPLPYEFQPYTLMYLTLRHERADQPYLLTDYSFSSISYQLPPPESFKTLYINELLHLLFRNRRSNYQFFDSYQSTLEAIKSNSNVDFSILNFENFLFQNLNLPIYSVNNSQPIAPNKKYQFSLSTGFVEVQSDSTDHIFWNQLNKNTHWQSAPLPPSDPNNQKLTLSGSEIHDILNLEFKQPNSIQNARALHSSIIASLTNNTEFESSKLYRNYQNTITLNSYTQESSELSQESSELSQESSELSQESSMQSQESSEPSQESSELSQESSMQSQESSEPSQESSEPSQESSEPSQESSMQSQESSELSQESSELSQESSELSQESSELSQESSELSQESSELSQESSELSQESSELSQESSELSQESSELSQESAPQSQESSAQIQDSTAKNTSAPQCKTILIQPLKSDKSLSEEDKKAQKLKNEIKKVEDKIKKYDRIFIDTSSLIYSKADQFWTNVVPLLAKHNKNIVIPITVYSELKNLVNNPETAKQNKSYIAAQGHKILQNVNNLLEAKTLLLVGDKNDISVDSTLQSVFKLFSLKYDLLLITQNRNLAASIIDIEKNRSQSAITTHQIKVMHIVDDGLLCDFDIVTNTDNSISAQRKTNTTNSSAVNTNEKFAIKNQITKVSESINITEYPSEGSELTAEGRKDIIKITLTKAGPSGGEGTIFFTNIPKIVAKIYKPGKLDQAKFEKLRLMMSKNLQYPGICLPKALLYNNNHEFVGYTMEQAEGKELQKCIFIPQLLAKNFPDWTKLETVTLCITILKKIKYLHDRNVILGDINPLNILVKSPTEVYFVDTDSYQIEGYPCPVGTVNFTAPEIQRKKYCEFLRTMGNERFAVATLLFMIMLPGKPPYSLQGGENQIDNIINADFAYPSGKRSNGKAPEGMWRFCWSHLPRFLKDDFYETFHKSGIYHDENARFSTDEWLAKFKRYLSQIKNGSITNYDEMSLSLFPTRRKKSPKNHDFI